MSQTQKKSLKDLKFLNDLWHTVSLIKTKHEARDFLKSLLTEEEMLSLAKRVSVAKLLVKNSSYNQVRKKIKVTNSKILSVKNHLKAGGGKGFLKILRRMEKQKK